MASPSLPDPRPGLRCGRPACPCRLPGASVHCPVCRAPKPSLDVAWRDRAWTLACASGCGSETIADAVRRLGLWPATSRPAGVHAPLGTRRLDAITPRPLTWLWPGFVPNDALTLLIGAPGVGTSWLAIDLAARVTTGAPAPDGNGRFPQGPVLIVSPDSPASSLLPRLDAQGADPAQVYVVESLRHADATEAAPRVQRDATHLQSVLAETGARLLIVDPIDAFAHGPLTQRRLLTALASIAVRTSTAVLAVAHQPHRDLAKIHPVHAELVELDPLFYMRLAAWYADNGDVRDHKEMFVITLALSEFEGHRDVAFAKPADRDSRSQGPFPMGCQGSSWSSKSLNDGAAASRAETSGESVGHGMSRFGSAQWQPSSSAGLKYSETP